MKASIVALGLAATLANATAFRPNHWHVKRDNTTLPGDSQTTLTVIATEVHTITSCAPTVTNCPANPTEIEELPESEKTTFVETVTRHITTTVCPVSEAPAISASIIGSATLSSVMPTMTSEAIKDEPTTTTTATTTNTSTVTVDPPTHTGEGESPEEGSGGPPTDAEGDDNDNQDGSCVCSSAVTVTVPASTVYVTIGGDQSGPAATPTGTVDDEDVKDEDKGDDEYDECDGDGDEDVDDECDGGDDEDEDDECDGGDDEDEDGDGEYECEPDVTSTLTATSHIPYPTGNGTGPIVPGPTGFAKRFRF